MALGTIGPLLALAPLASTHLAPIVCTAQITALLVGLWGVVLGGFVIFWWVEALHDRVSEWSSVLKEAGMPLGEFPNPPPRLPWMPTFLGGFERLIYVILLAFDVESGATFIGVWVAMKMAGGWQQLGGSPVGRATFTAGLLGNAMSVLYGVSAGAAVRTLLALNAA